MAAEAPGESQPFTYDGGRIDPGERQDLRYTISETYLGDPVRIPVTVVNGDLAGPTVVLTAASHGDELNGIEVIRAVTAEWDLSTLRGTLVCLPVLNVPGFLAQQRYLPIYDRDLNRSFPGSADGTNASRIAHRIFENFVRPGDLCIDFHTSTRGRTNMLHVRAEMDDPAIQRIARAFASHVVIDGRASEGTLRTEATDAGVPTITVEMGEAHRFQRQLIDEALVGLRSVFAEFDLLPGARVRWPGWRTVIQSDEKTWIRADVGGIVEMLSGSGEFVAEGETVARIDNPFKTERTTVAAPFDGLLVGVLENPVVYPGNPLCHFVELDADTRAAFEQAGDDRRARDGVGTGDAERRSDVERATDA